METQETKQQQKQILKTRTKTALIVGAFYVVYILVLFFSSRVWTRDFFIGTPVDFIIARFCFNFFNLLLIVVLAYFAAEEISKLCFGPNKKLKIVTVVLMFAGVMTIGMFILLTRTNYVPLPDDFKTLFITFVLSTLCVVLVIFTTCAIIAAVFYKKKIISDKKVLTWYPFSTFFLTLFFVAFFYVSVIHTWVSFLAIILISTLSDVFGYLIGSKIGKHKIAPNISPKKSWEGLLIGSFLITLAVVLGYYGFFFIYDIEGHMSGLYSFLGCQTCTRMAHYNLDPYFWTIYVGATLVLILVSVLGDLFFSWIKRKFNIKDFSNLLPGHGGMLDRLDALTFVFVFYFVLTIILQFATKNYQPYDGVNYLWDVVPF